MKKPVYKLLDEKGRILIPKEFRQMAELESGDIVKLSVSSGKIMVSKVDIVEMGSQDPQAVEAYVNAAVKHMSPAKQVALAARILKFAQQEGGGVKETAETSIGEGRRLRIYQLGQDSPIMMRFISLAERKKRGYDRPRREEYVRVYEGEIENYSLEEVWEKYGRRVPEGFQGHALSISDVIEFADGENSRFFYIEPSGYEEIRF